MPEPHLTTGSQLPLKSGDQIRLYSMEYCPYAQRVRLVLRAKQIPFETVNINLINKPDWYFKIHPEGKVPALDIGSQILVESLDVANYLDKNYPQNPLYPKDPEAKKRDEELIAKISPVTEALYKCLLKSDNKTIEDWAKEFESVLEPFESELKARGTQFFGGDKPGMVDYMLWPWSERSGAIEIAWGQKLPFGDDQFLLLRKWKKAMRDDPVCSEIYHGPEKFWKVFQMKVKNLPPDYDNI